MNDDEIVDETDEVEAAPVEGLPPEPEPVDREAFEATLEAAAAPEAAAPVAEGEVAVEAGPPFVLEEWVLNALEALAFNASDPLTVARARDVIAAEMAAMDGMEGKGEPTHADMKHAFRALLERWSQLAVSEAEGPVVRGFRLVEIDGALCFRTSAAQARFIRRMQIGRPQRLSRAALETLAVIAYRQPVTKPQIEEVRGVDCSGGVKALLDKKLIRVLGKAEEVGRPLLYGTTKTFLEFFEMQSLTDLPTLKELHELEHGVDPNASNEPADERPAVIMDLFNADQVSAVSEETERESTEAMEAFERALGEAKDVAKRASTLVFGMQVEEGEDGKPVKPSSAAAAETEEKAEEPKPKDEEPKA